VTFSQEATNLALYDVDPTRGLLFVREDKAGRNRVGA
jgi:hypothetical protein